MLALKIYLSFLVDATRAPVSILQLIPQLHGELDITPLLELSRANPTARSAMHTNPPAFSLHSLLLSITTQRNLNHPST